MKNNRSGGKNALIPPQVNLFYKTMRIFVFFCFFSVFCTFANTVSSQTAKVTIKKTNSSILEVLNEIEHQTNYLFIYSNEVNVKRMVSIDVNKKTLANVLSDLFSKNNIQYELEGNHIVLSRNATGKSYSTQQSKAGRKVSGKITDKTGEPIIGASIKVKGETTGTITDINGNFQLDVPQKANLEISYIGYKKQEANVGTSNMLNIVLEEDTKVLDEVVVVGYGSTSVKKMVSAVTALKGEDIQNLTATSTTGALQGRAAGVIVQQSGGEPGSVPSISIRGGGAPIYVIDGVISSAWEFNMLNPNDIQNLSILKDAASLAVYGSRAANGIVLVKTKEGKQGKTSITYSYDAKFSQPTVLPEKFDSYTYALLQNSTGLNDGLGEYNVYSADQLQTIKNQTDPYRYGNTDWLNLGMKSWAPEYRHSLSINGSSKLANYYLSLGVLDQGSLYKTNSLNYNRYTLRSNVNTTFENIGLTIGLNINGAIEKKEYPSFGANTIWDHLFSRSPLMPAYNADGTYTSNLDHPLVEMDERSGYDRQNGKFINTQLMANWELPWVKGMSIGTLFNYRLDDSHRRTFSTTAPQYNADGTLYKTIKPTLKETAKFGESYDFQVDASYKNTFFENHSIDAKVVFNASENQNSDFWASRKEYLSTAVDQLFAGSPVGQLNSGSAEEGGRLGIVGRLKYDYAGRYYIEGSFRYDGSDNFAPGYRWGFFPSVALAWDVTEEPFFKKLNIKQIDFLKFRASYGKTGTDTKTGYVNRATGKEEEVNRFGYLPTYSLDGNAVVIGGELQPGFSEGALVAPRFFSWYNRNSLNYGLDYGIFNNRLRGTIDYFYYVTKGGLMSPKDRYTTPLGKDLPQIKSESEQRREGVEMNISWGERKNEGLSYEVGFNWTYFNNLWAKKSDESLNQLMNPWKRETQQKDYYGTGYVDNGFYQTADQILNSPRPSASSETKLGDIAYKDFNGDGKIDAEDEVRMGMPTMPHFTYGINFMLGYKGFNLSGLLYGTGERYMEMGVHYKKGESGFIFDKAQLDYWREDNRQATFPRPSLSANVNGNNNLAKSTFWMKNASFLRLKDLRLTYDFKYKYLKRATWLNVCRLSITGSNLFTLSDVMDYFDPEAASTTGSYPVYRSFMFGLTVGF